MCDKSCYGDFMFYGEISNYVMAILNSAEHDNSTLRDIIKTGSAQTTENNAVRIFLRTII